MQATINEFKDRVSEIELYFQAIESLYDTKSSQNNGQKYYDDDFFKILKSNALLMIYNLVESTIMGGILEIYDDLYQHGITYRQVRKEIQDIWFTFKFNEVYDKKAHYDSYKDKAIEIINCILTDDVLTLDRKATNISGNLDAEKIRRICNDHGISFQISPQCKGGYVLTDVKEKRNSLAHGTLSFVECGRDYTMEDLEKTKKQTILFLKGILAGMKEYYDKQQYLRLAN